MRTLQISIKQGIETWPPCSSATALPQYTSEHNGFPTLNTCTQSAVFKMEQNKTTDHEKPNGTFDSEIIVATYPTDTIKTTLVLDPDFIHETSWEPPIVISGQLITHPEFGHLNTQQLPTNSPLAQFAIQHDRHIPSINECERIRQLNKTLDQQIPGRFIWSSTFVNRSLEKGWMMDLETGRWVMAPLEHPGTVVLVKSTFSK